MIIASLLSLAVALYCYAISQLQIQGKLRWQQNNIFGFWGHESWVRKYKRGFNGVRINAPNTWYYRTFGIYYVERWPTSATLTVMFTDGYHLFQSLWFTFVSLSIVLAIGWNLWWFLGILFGVRIVHWSTRKLLSK